MRSEAEERFVEDEIDMDTIEEDLERFQQDPFVKEALSKGVDLRQYALEIDSELSSLQVASIPEFIVQAPKTAELYNEINECDKMLANMERILLGFQSDLGGISDEIKHLQTESLSMSVKLKNRKEIEQVLKKYLEQLVVPESLIVGICQHQVNETYLEYLKSLDDKIKFARDQNAFLEKYTAPCNTGPVQDVEPQLEKLRLKAVSKVRVFLLSKINELRNQKTNIGMIQQNVFLKFSYFVQFLQSNAPAVYEEIRSTYVETMSGTLARTFKSYYSSLLRMKIPSATSEDVIAAKSSFIKEAYASPSSTSAAASSPGVQLGFLSMPKGATSTSIFSKPPTEGGSGSTNRFESNVLAKRDQALGSPDAPPLGIHQLQREKKQLYFESIFRTVQCHLMNSVTSEYMFTLEFFDAKTRDLFNQIFAKTLSLCLEHLENELFNCYDVITILLMIKTTQAHQFIMERRKVPCLDGYFDHINMMLWPQFKKVFDLHLKSLQSPATASLGSVQISAHYVSQRYAEFSAIVYALNSSLRSSDAMLSTNLVSLRDAYMKTLEALCKLGKESRVLLSRKSAAVFTINNIDFVLRTLRSFNYPVDSSLLAFFEERVKQETVAYVEEELRECYGRIVGFVKTEEQNISQGKKPTTSQSEVVTILAEFNSTWKGGLELLNSFVMTYFTTQEHSREILKQMLTQLLLYYTRFQDILKKHYEIADNKGVVQIPTIMEEIKRFSRPT